MTTADDGSSLPCTYLSAFNFFTGLYLYYLVPVRREARNFMAMIRFSSHAQDVQQTEVDGLPISSPSVAL